MFRIILFLFIIHVVCFAAPPSNLVALRADILEGNRNTPNYILNQSCRKNTLNITKTGSGTLTADTSSTGTLDGKSECEINAAASGDTYTWVAGDMADELVGNNCEVSFSYFGADSLYKAYAINVDGVKSGEITLTNDGSYPKQSPKLTLPCGGTFDNNSDAPDLVIEATDNAAGVLSVANVYSGRTTSIGQFSAFSEPVSFTPTGGWSSNTTYTGSYQRYGNRAIIQYTVAVSGAPTSANLTLNLPNGIVIDTSKLPGTNTSATRLDSKGSVLDSGTATFDVVGIYQSSSSFLVAVLNSSSTYTTTTTVTQAVPMTFANGDRVEITIDVPILGWSASQSAAAADQADYGTTSYTPSFQGFGTPTITNSHDCTHMRLKEYLLISCKWTNGTVTASEGRIGLPNSKTVSSTLIPTLKIVGFYNRGNSSTGIKRGPIQATGGDTYLTFGIDDAPSSTSPFSKLNGSTVSSSSEVMNVWALVPITGWVDNQRAPTNTGSITSNTLGALRMETARVSGGNPPTISTQSSTPNWLTFSSRSGAGSYAWTTSGVFGSAPECLCNIVGSSTAYSGCQINPAPTTSGFTTVTQTTGGTGTDLNISIMCIGPR